MRITNRALLLVGGAFLLAAGVLAVLSVASPDDARSVVQTWSSTYRDTTAGWEDTTSLPWAAILPIAAGGILVILLIVFLSTRRGSRRARMVLTADSTVGKTSAHRRVAHDLIAGAVAQMPEVSSAHLRATTIRGQLLLSLTVRPRAGADISRIVSVAESALAEWDQVAGQRLPVIFHIADRGLRDIFHSSVRVR